MPGLLDFNMNLDPKTQGLLGLGQGLLSASGYSPTPISMGQAMGQGLKSGLGAYTQAQQAQQKRKGKIEVKTIPWGVDADGKPQKRAVAIQNGEVVGFPGETTPTTPGVQINMPVPPPKLDPGKVWADPTDPAKGMITVPGSAAAQREKKRDEAKKLAIKQAKTQATRMVGHIDRARSQSKGVFVTGLPGSILKAVPGTGAHDLAQTIQTIKANTTFDKLLAVKKAGGSLGAINEAELGLLGSAVSNLEQSQSEEQFKHNLDIVDELYAKIIKDDDAKGMSRLEYLRAKRDGTL